MLLRFVAVYSLFDSMNLVFSFALRGAGDTRFVTVISLVLSWPLMVVPTWAAWHYGWGLYWSWTFASVHIIALGITFLLRFRAGKWKSMRVIERAPIVFDEDQGSRVERRIEPRSDSDGVKRLKQGGYSGIWHSRFFASHKSFQAINLR